MMTLVLMALATSVNAFRLQTSQVLLVAPQIRRSTRLPRQAPSCKLDELDVKDKQFAAGAAGFVLGTCYGGPVAGAIFAAGCNQGSKGDGTVGDLLLSMGEVTIKIWNEADKFRYSEVMPRLRKVDGFRSNVEPNLRKFDDFLMKSRAGPKAMNALEKVEDALDSAGDKIRNLT